MCNFGKDEQVRTGFLLVVENTGFLTEPQCQSLIGKLGVLAVSTQGLFDDPVLIKPQTIEAYYTRDYHAQETLTHIRQYLHEIGLGKKVTVTLQSAQWNRRQ